jgi:hypothetical protein
MTEEERWNHLLNLDEELHRGDVILSEWCCFVVREADTAFAKGAHLASILTAVSGIETYLRSEHHSLGKARLADLIGKAAIPETLKEDLHKLRVYRNHWVHVDEPWEDKLVQDFPELYEKDLEYMALAAARMLRATIYSNPGV